MSDLTQSLAKHKKAIDTDIAEYVTYLKSSTKAQYDQGSQLALDAYCDVLTRGGKRLRGALVIEGYKMCGGTNQTMIMQAARAIEMIHAYLLILDDIQDRSSLRRGGPTAHIQLAATVKDEHLAETLGVNAALLGCHAAMMILANLDAPAELRSNVLSILNRTLVVTIHGQNSDAMNQYNQAVTEHDVRRSQEWKTATYSILNPIHVGMVLAGADCHATDGVTPYAMALGQAFQITDDIIGVFGTASQTGKNASDDIKEGKRTLMMVYALNHAPVHQKAFLLASLGNQNLTATEFKKCQTILKEVGALQYSQDQAEWYTQEAIKALVEGRQYWSTEGTTFFESLASYILARTH